MVTLVRFAAVGMVVLCLLPQNATADDAPPLSIYGFARLDFILDDSTMSDVNQPQYVESELPGAGNNGEFSMHPRLSRIGLTMDPWAPVRDLIGEGKLEVDFQNGGGPNQPSFIQLRHAYFTLSLAGKVELLAGQTWDLISPLFPAANHDSMMWNAGNTGARRPQLRLTTTPTDKVRVGFAAGMTGAVDGKDMDGDGRLDGMESGTPMFQWLIEYRMRLLTDAATRFGMWGHVGSEETGDGTNYATSSFGVHAYIPLTDSLTILGEFFAGRNLSDIRGGIGNGVNMTTGEEIHAIGGWAEIVYIANERHMLAAGSSVDQPATEDIEAGDRDQNTTLYFVHRYRPHPALQVGLEFIHWNTIYKMAPNGRANRFNMNFTMFF